MKVSTLYTRISQPAKSSKNYTNITRNINTRNELTRKFQERAAIPLFYTPTVKNFSTNNQHQLKKKDIKQSPTFHNFYYKSFKSSYCTSTTSEKIDNLTILWGSQTGTAKSFAEDLHHQILDKNILEKSNVRIFDLGDFQNDKLTDEKLAIFLTSCYGEGEPTDNARNFFMWLMDEQRDEEKEKFKNMKFTIFGLGSSKAHRERYQVVARYLDQRMTELGAQKFFETGEGDDSEDIESDFEKWKTNLIEKLTKCSVKPTNNTQTENSEEKIDDYSVLYFDQNTPVADIRVYNPKEEVGPNNLFPSRLVDSVEVCPKSKRTTKQIWLSIKGSNISYEAGDYVCVQPKNSEENIQRAAQRLNVNLNANFSIIEKNANSLPLSLIRFKDKKTNIRKVLEEYVDLQAFVSPSILRGLASFAYLPEEKEKLLAYSETGGKFSEIKRERKSLIDILLEFPSLHLPWLKFLELSPVLNPRYYSIASSSHQTKDLISIVTRRVNFHTPGGKYINGLCSTYLTKILPKNLNNVEMKIDGVLDVNARNQVIDKLIANSEENEMIYMYHKKSTFRLPTDPLVPIIMVAGGCGIAPFIGFLKEREYLLSQGVTLGPSHLFFGCRNEDEMMFRSYILNAVQKGVITNAYLAYSEASPPVLVTDLLGKENDVIYPLMEKGHIYMCGAAFANAAFNSFCKIIVNSGKASQSEAEQQMKAMILDGRYHEDLQ